MNSLTTWLVIALATMAGLAHLVMAYRQQRRAFGLFYLLVGGTMLTTAGIYLLALVDVIHFPQQGPMVVRPLVILMTGLFLGYALLLWDNKR